MGWSTEKDKEMVEALLRFDPDTLDLFKRTLAGDQRQADDKAGRASQGNR